MDYQLENLGPEKFQMLCQALLVSNFPKLQCFPVAQPDGGRDATSIFAGRIEEGFIVFQVKYNRKPQAEKDPHQWLKDTLKDEAPKIERLIPKGATEYYLRGLST